MKTILLIEDLEDDYLILARAFEKAKIPAELKWRKDGKEACDWLSEVLERRPHELPLFALCDLKMPRMNGFELLEWLRTQPLLRRLPLIVLTSSDAALDVNRAYELGSNGYLVKPRRLGDITRTAEALHQYWIAANKQPDFS